jgi:hypothetical protein
VKIERHYYTPTQLKQVGAESGWQNVDEAIAAAKKFQEATAGKSPSKPNRTPGAYIEPFAGNSRNPLSALAILSATPESL